MLFLFVFAWYGNDEVVDYFIVAEGVFLRFVHLPVGCVPVRATCCSLVKQMHLRDVSRVVHRWTVRLGIKLKISLGQRLLASEVCNSIESLPVRLLIAKAFIVDFNDMSFLKKSRANNPEVQLLFLHWFLLKILPRLIKSRWTVRREARTIVFAVARLDLLLMLMLILLHVNLTFVATSRIVDVVAIVVLMECLPLVRKFGLAHQHILKHLVVVHWRRLLTIVQTASHCQCLLVVYFTSGEASFARSAPYFRLNRSKQTNEHLEMWGSKEWFPLKSYL